MSNVKHIVDDASPTGRNHRKVLDYVGLYGCGGNVTPASDMPKRRAEAATHTFRAAYGSQLAASDYAALEERVLAHEVTKQDKHMKAQNLMALLSMGIGKAFSLGGRPKKELPEAPAVSPYDTYQSRKGQQKQAPSKPSNAAALKRAAKKRNNIRKHK